MNGDMNGLLTLNEDGSVTDNISGQLLTACECDNTHKQHDTVCRFCWAHGLRKWVEPSLTSKEIGRVIFESATKEMIAHIRHVVDYHVDGNDVDEEVAKHFLNNYGSQYDDETNWKEVADEFCNRLPQFTLSRFCEVNANGLWDAVTDVNCRFCETHNRAKAQDGAMYVMDGTSHTEILETAKEFGCTQRFMEAFKLAIDSGSEFVMFYHDV